MGVYQYNGTILAGGTLSSQIDLGEATSFGLVVPTFVGTATFGWYAGDKSDSDGGVYVALKNASGAISHGSQTTGFAVDSVSLSVLQGHRFVRLHSSAAITSGLSFRVFGKTE